VNATSLAIAITADGVDMLDLNIFYPQIVSGNGRDLNIGGAGPL
jgi:hypothetical protein